MSTASNDPIVQTSLGTIRGRRRDGIEQYLGIRYAQAPVADLRFAAPVPVEAWTGECDATRLGPVAPQPARPEGSPLPSREFTYDEDCLVLNIYTPASDGGRRPVLVWIHGGAYVRGSGDVTDGTSFAQLGDIVVVTLNYRLGALGFMELGHLDPTLAGSQNNGIRDQIAALEWVHAHIDRFGGDPDQVTIAGESAGAGSVMALLASPAADKLFHQAISQSAPAGFQKTKLGAEEALVEALGCSGGRGMDRLRSASAAEILEAQEAISVAHTPSGPVLFGNGGRGFRPGVDKHTVTRTAVAAVTTAGNAAKPLLIGSNLDEGTLFSFHLPPEISDDELREAVATHTSSTTQTEAVVEAFAETHPYENNRQRLIHMQGDTMFRIPSLRVADAQVRAGGGPIYTYLFTWRSAGFGGLMGSMHALEIPFVWNQDLAPWAPLIGNADPGNLAERMHRSWIAFVRDGNPSHDLIGDWPAYELDRRPTMEFGTTSSVQHDPRGLTRAAWG